MSNHGQGGHSAAQNCVRFGIWGMKRTLRGIGYVFMEIKWAAFPGKGITFSGMNSRSTGEKVFKHIAWWGVKYKNAPYSVKRDTLGLAAYIRRDILPLLDGRKLPIDKRRMKDDGTWDHVKSILDSHAIPYVII